jgi:hypothetical protein
MRTAWLGLSDLEIPPQLKLLIRNSLVGERGFEPLASWSRTWGRGADFVSIQSFEWCFNRLSLAQSRQFGRNVNPPIATLAQGVISFGS